MHGDIRGFRELISMDLTDVNNHQALARRVAEMRARLDVGNLITFTSSDTVQIGRLELIKSISEGIYALQSAGILPPEEVASAVRASYNEWRGDFTTDKSTQDRAFRNYRLKQSLRAGARGAVQGAAAGLIVGETVKLANRVAQELNIDFGAIISTPARAAEPKIAPKSNIISGRSAQELVFQAERPSIKTGDKLASVIPIDSTPQTETPIKTANLHQTLDAITPTSSVESNLDGKPLTIPEYTRWRIDPVNGGTDLISSRDGRVLLNNVHWENGQLQAEPGLWNPTDQITTETTSTPDIKKVMGKNGLWEDLSVDPRKVRWDNNGTPGISDGDELRLFDKRDGNGVVFKIPKSADGVFLNVNGERVWIPKSGDSHLVRLDPDSRIKIPGRTDGMTYGDVARMTIDQDELRKYHGSLQTEVYTDRRKIFRVDAIEAADFKNGKATIVASIKGEGHLPKEFKVGTQTNTTFKIIPGEIPVEPTPTPTPSPTPTPTPTPEPTPTPVPTPEPTPTPIPTPEPTPTPTPDATPSPTAPVQTPEPTQTTVPTPSPTPESSPSPSPNGGGGFINNIPDMTNLGLDIPVVLPFTPRYGLEKMESSTGMTPATPLPPSGFTPPPPFPSGPTPLAPTPRPSRGFTERRRLENLHSETRPGSNTENFPDIGIQRTSEYYDRVAKLILPFDSSNPKTPQEFLPIPITGSTTLAGIISDHIYYENLAFRADGTIRTPELEEKNTESILDFEKYLDEVNDRRRREGKNVFTKNNEPNSDGFSLTGKESGHAFYFKKSITYCQILLCIFICFVEYVVYVQ
jgi:outer membrane biosynthesis protein TonB